MVQPLIQHLTERVGQAFEKAGLAPDYGTVVVSARRDLAQFQCNGAMAAAKAARKDPREIATAVAGDLEGDPLFAKVEIAGPGFLNIDVTDAHLSATADAIAADARCGMPEMAALSVMIDFGGPNVAKPMHVGHLRTAIIGDCLQRVFAFAGHRVTSDIHLGDWGLQMGMVLVGLASARSGEARFGNVADPDRPSLDELEKLYPAVSAASKEDAAVLAEARRITARLQEGDSDSMRVWRNVLAASVAGLKQEYAALGVSFDLWKGESDVQDRIPAMVERLHKAGVARESDGALIVPVAQDSDTAEIPPLILQKSDGSALYATTDLATIVDRVESYDPELILYVVDQRQHLHFEQVFRAARAGGLAGRAALEHVGYGTVNGPDGRPFKTRAGGVLRLADMLDMAMGEARKRIEEAGLAKGYGAGEQDAIARMVGVAAIKFADLSNWRMSNYIFDLDRFTRFEGKTGPYLQYAAVRIQSLLAKAEAEGKDGESDVRVQSGQERDLVLALAAFPDAVSATIDRRGPNALCDYVFGLAQAFSRFYTEHHILSEPDEAVRGSRLRLARATHRVLTTALDLLGIGVPARM